MTARLVSLGDSLTQGFQHGAIRRTAWAFPALVARALGAEPFRAPDFSGGGGGGPLLDLELLLGRLSMKAGQRLDLYDVPSALFTVQQTMGLVEDYWERGPGTQPSDTGPIHHNLGNWGFDVLDATTLSDAVCAKNTPPPHHNLLRQLPENAMYRSARRACNPAQRRDLAALTPLGLAHRLGEEDGIENLLVGLGANNALGTCVSLKLRRSHHADLALLAHERDCNLWEPDHFAIAYRDLARQLERISAKRVFLTTVPHVTIAPVTRGVSPHARASGGSELEGGYYEYYTSFWIWDQHFSPERNRYLTREQARQVDFSIDAYNQSIVHEARSRGWHVIDLCQLLDQLAFRRHDGRPPYRFPAGLVQALADNPLTAFRVRPDGEVLLDTRYIRIPATFPAESASSREWRTAFKGGLFGLDGVHPTTIGYGLVAHEVLRAFQAAGVPGADPSKLDWPAIVANDTLLTETPALLVSLERTLDALFAKLPLDALIEKLGGYGAEEL
ncbi:MAG TPA: hypothetical protein VEQ58_05310 [Polyangiaceae bacterium]|nr:hypothetical protein [Polyangiaceae bacterium]